MKYGPANESAMRSALCWFKSRLEVQGAVDHHRCEYIAAEIPKWARIVRKSGARME
jgi:hypothetical protein